MKKKKVRVNYEKAWNELEDEIRRGIDISIIITSDENPSVTDKVTINSLDRAEKIMHRIKEKYSKEEA